MLFDGGPAKPKLSVQTQLITPQGKPPCPRFLHTATLFKHYLVIYGGRCDEIYQEINSVALNDISLYNIESNTWESLVIYGDMPCSRWGHSFVATDKHFIVFGGINSDRYCNADLFAFTFDPKIVENEIQLRETQIQKLKDEAKRKKFNEVEF